MLRLGINYRQAVLNPAPMANPNAHAANVLPNAPPAANVPVAPATNPMQFPAQAAQQPHMPMNVPKPPTLNKDKTFVEWLPRITLQAKAIGWHEMIATKGATPEMWPRCQVWLVRFPYC